MGARSSLETQHHFKAPGDLWVITRIKNAVINIGLVRLSLTQCPADVHFS